MNKYAVPKPEDDDDKDEALKCGILEESEEHPWLAAADVKQLVKDHLAMDPDYYKEEEED
jgi:hypothetical protein